jgi:cytosine/adenosine deaminase-related metal-dependent hydrolase
MGDHVGYRARWVMAARDGGTMLLTDATVVVSGERIADILPASSDGQPARMVELGQKLLMPGIVNAHTHCVSGPLFRGLIEDLPLRDGPGSVIDSIMLPLGEIVSEICTQEDVGAIAALGQLEALKAGSTTLVDMPRARHEAFAEAAEQIGLRAFIHPYLMSPAEARTLEGEEAERLAQSQIADVFGRWHRRFDGRGNGRIRIGLGPHATDTCSPALLRAIARTRDEFGVRVVIHASQSREEVRLISQRFGISPIAHLDRLGLLTPDLIAAHCVYAEDSDLQLMARRGVTLVHCPLSFGRIGVMTAFARFTGQGVRTLIGSDAHALDPFADIRLAAINSKIHTGDTARGTAQELLHAATRGAAEALGQENLGRLCKGASADMIAISFEGAHMQPVHDPIRNLVWNGSGQDVDFVMVAGMPLVESGKYVKGDEKAIIGRGAAALDRVFELARERGILPRIGAEGS